MPPGTHGRHTLTQPLENTRHAWRFECEGKPLGHTGGRTLGHAGGCTGAAWVPIRVRGTLLFSPLRDPRKP
ncbi:hypothetical protein [Caulobacter phage S2B]|uniref:Uncharacterized protein n=1 Tax=Caulobacter phage S2B TaxID=2759120 RepID=A0AAE7ML67_9CAUD|nr:hypothetical protein [Caulobacter phage S2B]